MHTIHTAVREMGRRPDARYPFYMSTSGGVAVLARYVTPEDNYIKVEIGGSGRLRMATWACITRVAFRSTLSLGGVY